MESEALLRREKSIEILKKYHVPYMEKLPVIETKDAVKIRSKEEIARRAITCLIMIQLACDLNQLDSEDEIKESKQFVVEMLEKYNVTHCLTDNEKRMFDSDVTQQEIINMVWKYEAYWTLLWSLKLVDTLDFPCNICDCDYAIKVISTCQSFQEVLDKCQLRSIDEILDEADLIFRYDWACVDARINGRNMPANLNSSVVLERHRGLNWLIDVDEDDDWDNVSTNT